MGLAEILVEEDEATPSTITFKGIPNSNEAEIIVDGKATGKKVIYFSKAAADHIDTVRARINLEQQEDERVLRESTPHYQRIINYLLCQ